MSKKLGKIVFLIILFLFFLPNNASAQVVINEFSSFESTGDWVELFSPENMDISGYILRDTAATTIGLVPAGTTIGPSTNKYFVLEVGNRLNKDGDVVKLLKPDDQILVDQIPYGNEGGVCAPNSSGSVARIPDGGNTIDRLAIFTKGSTNGEIATDSCPVPTETPTPTLTPLPTPTKTPTPTPTPRPTATAKPTSTNSPTPTKSPTSTPTTIQISNSDDQTGTPYPTLQESSDSSEVLGFTTEKSNNRDKNEIEGDKEGNNFNLLPYVLIGFGVLLSGYSGYSLYKTKKNNE